MINVCIPTLNSIETFWKCVESIKNSSIQCEIYVVDNGGLVKNSYPGHLNNFNIYTPYYNIGVAASWNWFIDNTKEYRIITNDDIVFDQYAIEQLVYGYIKNPMHVISPENLGNAFSCFLLHDDVVNKVGKFDEWISPNYAYFEDNDYHYRMTLAGVELAKADGSFVEHVGSSTLKNYDFMDTENHHRKFRAARDRYTAKWGGEPNNEVYKTPFNRG